VGFLCCGGDFFLVDGDPPPKSIEPDIFLVLALMQQMAMMMRTKKTREIRTAPAAAMPMIAVIPSCGPGGHISSTQHSSLNSVTHWSDDNLLLAFRYPIFICKLHVCIERWWVEILVQVAPMHV